MHLAHVIIQTMVHSYNDFPKPEKVKHLSKKRWLDKACPLIGQKPGRAAARAGHALQGLAEWSRQVL